MVKKIPFGPIGYITYKRTYARNIENETRTEEFEETIDRVLKASQNQLKVGFTPAEVETARGLMLDLKCSVAGRFLWQLGTQTVDKLGLASLQNCAAIVVDHPITPFTWAFDMLCLGSGVGYSISKVHTDKIPPVLPKKLGIVLDNTKSADFIVPDTRSGWVALLEKVLEAFFYKGKGFSYSTHLIRKKGEHIAGFGGTASGPEILGEGIDHIVNLLNSLVGQKLRPIHCLDIMNIIGSIVVAGNVRRSAQLAIGDMDDVEYLRAKRWDLGNVPNWRAMSNNSVFCNDTSKLPEEFWEGYKGNGEPYGLINIELSQDVGRLADGGKYPDKKVMIFNPCAEQSLESGETCALGEMFLPRFTNYKEFLTALRIIYRIIKHSLALPCHQEITEEVVHRNMRMGIGITGYLQTTEEQKSWLSPAYKYLRKLDVKYSKANGFPTSIKLTTCKPSGTLSLLPNVTPGVHPGYSKHYIRRIRIASDSVLSDICKKNGYPVEFQRKFDGTTDFNTVVASFPCSYPDHTVFAKDCTAIDQLEWVKRLQTEWSDNAVSCTVYYKKDELDSIKEWLNKNFTHSTKTVSFLLHNDHGFDQAPYEEITEQQYNAMSAKTTPITSGNILDDKQEQDECIAGVCPIK